MQQKHLGMIVARMDTTAPTTDVRKTSAVKSWALNSVLLVLGGYPRSSHCRRETQHKRGNKTSLLSSRSQPVSVKGDWAGAARLLRIWGGWGLGLGDPRLHSKCLRESFFQRLKPVSSSIWPDGIFLSPGTRHALQKRGTNKSEGSPPVCPTPLNWD